MLYLLISCLIQFSLVQSLSHVQIFVTHGLQHARLPCPSPTPRAYSNSCPLSLLNHLILCRPLLQPTSFFPSIRVFSSESVLRIRWPNIGVSASISVLPLNIQDWFPLGLTGLISLQFNGLSRVFSNTTGQKHQFFGVQLSSQPNIHIHTWPLEKPQVIINVGF